MGPGKTKYDLIAEFLEVDEAEVIDNEDGLSVTVYETIYNVIDLPHGITDFTFCMFPIN